MESRARLAELLSPLSLAEFFGAYFDKKPAVVRGRPERVQSLISLRRLVDMVVSKEDHPVGKVFARREHLAPEALASTAAWTGVDLANRTAMLWAYLEAGHPLVWNGARGATPALDELTGALAGAFGAHVWPNLYATGTAGTALDMHFDAHEVLAVQCEGAKEWCISKVRINCPLDVPALASTIRQALEFRSEEARREILMTFTVQPGDVVYIPRGQFHNARATAGRSLHVTFAIAPTSGLDALEALSRLAVREALFREYLTVRLEDPSGTRERAQLQRLGERLAELSRSDDLPRVLEEMRAELMARSVH
jgi:ribosomal protein L16 Arg81 hydroxylase